jgi:hypothetical protein
MSQSFDRELNAIWTSRAAKKLMGVRPPGESAHHIDMQSIERTLQEEDHFVIGVRDEGMSMAYDQPKIF